MEPTEPHSNPHDTARLVAREFRKRHGDPIGIFRAPGRVNLIGEHTDYNDGFVMPAALAFYTYAAAGLRDDRKLSVYSVDFDEACDVELDSLEPGSTACWVDYVRGVAAVMVSLGIPVRGANLVVKGEVPMGAGLSSSAAIEVATALALLAVACISLDRRVIASICQRAEHEFAGPKCGIMDQFISCFGKANHALLLDCRSLECELLAIGSQIRMVICNTMVNHELAGGEYNRRRADCEAGVDFLRQYLPEIRALRDVNEKQLVEFGTGMSDVTYRRCRHVISENARVLEAAAALKRNDLERFGSLMGASHASLRDDYEVSCPELDLLVELARNCQGVYGARMTGGGFGGCTVNLVETEAVDEFRAAVAREYQQATGLRPEIYVCTAADGAGEISIPGA
jgi:galactokinase